MTYDSTKASAPAGGEGEWMHYGRILGSCDAHRPFVPESPTSVGGWNAKSAPALVNHCHHVRRRQSVGDMTITAIVVAIITASGSGMITGLSAFIVSLL